MLHVRQLVGDHAFELTFVQDLQDALRRGHSRVLRVAASGKRVRRWIRNDVHLRHRQAGLTRQPLGDAIERMLRANFLRAVHAQHDLVREPVRTDVHDDGDHQADHQAIGAAEDVPDDEQQAGQRAE